MNASTVIPIDKLMFWRAVGGWVKYETRTCDLTLRLICDQILITNEQKILESLNVNSKIKGIYKGNVLVLIIGGTGQETRKIRFQIKSELEKNLHALGQRFPVLDNEAVPKNTVHLPRYRNIEDIIKLSIEFIEKQEVTPMPMPQNFANFVKLCLLDPHFPALVNETQKVLENEFEK